MNRGRSWRVALARWVLVLGAVPATLAAAWRAVCSSIAIGLLGRKALAEYVEQVYVDKLDEYDPRAVRLDCEERVHVELVRFHPNGRLLNLFCGQAREAEYFATRGYEVTGVDSSAEMIARGRAYADQVGFAVELIEADCFAWQPDGTYDVIYLSPWMYGTFPDAADRIRLLRHYLSGLGPAGVLAISYRRQARPTARDERIRDRVAAFAATLTRSDRRPRPGDRLISDVFQHLFTDQELQNEIEAAGYERVVTKQSPTGTFDFAILRASRS